MTKNAVRSRTRRTTFHRQHAVRSRARRTAYHRPHVVRTVAARSRAGTSSHSHAFEPMSSVRLPPTEVPHV